MYVYMFKIYLFIYHPSHFLKADVDDEVDYVMERIDANGDGAVSFQEFLRVC